MVFFIVDFRAKGFCSGINHQHKFSMQLFRLLMIGTPMVPIFLSICLEH